MCVCVGGGGTCVCATGCRAYIFPIVIKLTIDVSAHAR